MRLVLLGAPGSGKGTQAARLKEHLQVPHISTGDLLRAEVAAGSPLGLRAKQVMARGDLVSDDILLGMLRDRFSRDDTRAGFILDGYPRNLAQAAALDKLLAELGQAFDAAVQLTVDNEQIIERLAGRAKAEGRADDTPESVRHRLNVYDQQTAPVIDFYRQHGQLTVVAGRGVHPHPRSDPAGARGRLTASQRSPAVGGRFNSLPDTRSVETPPDHRSSPGISRSLS